MEQVCGSRQLPQHRHRPIEAASRPRYALAKMARKIAEARRRMWVGATATDGHQHGALSAVHR